MYVGPLWQPPNGSRLRLSPARLELDPASGGEKTVSLNNDGEGELADATFGVSYEGDSGWLEVDRQGRGNDQVLVNRLSADRPAEGGHRATVTVTVPGAEGSPASYVVSLSAGQGSSADPAVGQGQGSPADGGLGGGQSLSGKAGLRGGCRLSSSRANPGLLVVSLLLLALVRRRRGRC